ncbi:MAG: lysophospholipid acyltransferase family protein [Vicinamibacterales bacterium]|jgi:lysophospholipid acyltransferase (LPLAT)-like uncharacterized protein
MPAPTEGWRRSRWKRAQVRAISAVAWPIIEGLGGTYHWVVSGREHLDAIAAGGRAPIFAFWHGRVLSATLFFRDRGIIVITSENFDGEWIARVIGKFGYGTARGSSSRGGARALVQLRRDLAAGSPVAFTVDGPRGPARHAQPGAVWLAGATGHPILPFHIEASPAWTARSWDRHQVPKPGATVSVAIGEPIYVARTDDDTVEQARQQLERTLGALEQHARSVL